MKVSFTEKKNKIQLLGDLFAGDCFMCDNITYIKTNRYDEGSRQFSMCVNLTDGTIEAINTNATVCVLDAELVVYQ